METSSIATVLKANIRIRNSPRLRMGLAARLSRHRKPAAKAAKAATATARHAGVKVSMTWRSRMPINARVTATSSPAPR